jgi:hypothetical protein
MRKHTVLILLLMLTACHKAQPAQPPAKETQFVIEDRSRLVYNCNKFESQIKTRDDIVTMNRRGVVTVRELRENGNLALMTSIAGSIQRNDSLRTEQLVVTYECGKLRAPKE